MEDKKIIALAGATGNLGGLIAAALLDKEEVTLRCLVRSRSRGETAALEARGAEIVEGGLDPGSEPVLKKLCAGAYAVVSAVQGWTDVIVDGQLRLFRAAAAAGVRRFIPSAFSFDLFNLVKGENVMSDQRRCFAVEAEREGSGVELVHVLNGCFLDRRVLFGFLGAFDLGKGTAFLWGEGNVPMDFTTYHDTALYTAEAAMDPEPLPQRFNVAGDVLNFHQLVAACEAGAGKKLTVERLGSMTELDARIGELVAADPANVNAYLPLMYYRAMLNGKGKLGPLVNSRYPRIRPLTVREYVAREQL